MRTQIKSHFKTDKDEGTVNKSPSKSPVLSFFMKRQVKKTAEPSRFLSSYNVKETVIALFVFTLISTK